jgi:hypothetical protein
MITLMASSFMTVSRRSKANDRSSHSSVAARLFADARRPSGRNQ